MREKMLIMAIIPKSDWLSCRARMMPNTMPSNCCTVLFRPPQSSPFAVFSFRVSAIVVRLWRCSMLLRSVQCPSDSSRRLRRCSMLLRSVQCPSGCSMRLRRSARSDAFVRKPPSQPRRRRILNFLNCPTGLSTAQRTSQLPEGPLNRPTGLSTARRASQPPNGPLNRAIGAFSTFSTARRASQPRRRRTYR